MTRIEIDVTSNDNGSIISSTRIMESLTSHNDKEKELALGILRLIGSIGTTSEKQKDE